jgi:molybdate transport system substrate-binding protein
MDFQRTFRLAVAATVTLAIAAASTLTGLGIAGAARPAAPRTTGSITVSAASSLTEVFNRLGKDFERKYRGTSVTFNYGASNVLETQIEQGAPADAFASADTATADKLVAAGHVVDLPVVFARNRLEIAVAKGNPKKIRTLADTVKPGIQLVLCAAAVPCGKFARQAFAKAGVTLPEVPTGQDVKDTLSTVRLGAADAAVVYVTDVKSARGQVVGVPIPTAQNVIASYPFALVTSASNPNTAQAFISYVTSRAGEATLATFGFVHP